MLLSSWVDRMPIGSHRRIRNDEQYHWPDRRNPATAKASHRPRSSARQSGGAGSPTTDGRSHGRPIVADQLVQPRRDLAERAVFDRFDELREHVAAPFDHL